MFKYYEIPLWKDVKISEWTNWKWQIRNVITSLDDLEKVVHLSNDEKNGIEKSTKYLKMRITPFLTTLFDIDNPQDSLRKQFVPSIKEIESIDNKELFADVNADERFSPVKGLIHRYPSKVLIFPSNYCGAYCRYCFRRKLVREIEETLSNSELIKIFGYLKNNNKIEEVILSGGDPLVLDDEKLKFILDNLKKIEHVKILRFHTRLPVSIPYRISSDFVSMIKTYKKHFPIYFVIHIDSPKEITNEFQEIITTLIENGYPCLASCPLLKGINDDEMILRTLWTDLIKIRVKPYYLFQSDPVQGLKHYLVPLKRGIEIMTNLYDRMSGLAMPLYCFNVPNGGGHVLISNNYIQTIKEGHHIITTFEGKKFEYKESI